MQILNIKKDKGFTLIELLVAISVIVVVGAIILSILFSSLRVTNKTNNLTIVRQAGNSAITQMAKMLRNAKNLDHPSSLLCTQSGGFSSSYVTFTSFDNGQTVFSCDSNTISSNSASLLDINTVTLPDSAPDFVPCSFTCIQDGILGFPTVEINFSLNLYNSSGIIAERSASASAIPFNTTVTLRNLRK